MSRIIASIARPSLLEMIDAAREALRAGADLVELRLDAIPDALIDSATFDVTPLGSLSAGRWIATLRADYENGGSKLPDTRRAAILARCINVGAGCIDIEHQAIRGSADVRAMVSPIGDAGKLIISTHDFGAGANGLNRRDWPGIVTRMAAEMPSAIVKVAWTAEDISDNITAMRICRDAPGRRIAICMGEKGAMSRVLADKCQSFGAYCALDSKTATAPGQLTVEQLTSLYRCGRQSAETHVYGVIGSPVAHSLSPLIFNQQFARDWIDAVYLPLRIDTTDELERFLSNCRSTEWLCARGFSVTLPHKQSALAWADQSEPLAERIGAANTLHLTDQGSKALNTDYRGLIDALVCGLDVGADKLRTLNVAILGAGGVARAAVAALRDLGCAVTIYNRSMDRADSLANEFDCRAEPWDRRLELKSDLVINCTSVGLWPNVDETPLPAAAMGRDVAIMDTIYKPIRTRLLREAAARRCRTVSGVEMFIRQAAAQHAIWTGRAMDIDAARSLVHDAIGGGDQPEAAP